MGTNTLEKGERKAKKALRTKTSDPGNDIASQPERAKERELTPPSLNTGSNQVDPPSGGEKALEKPTSEKLISPREYQSPVKNKQGNCEDVELGSAEEDEVEDDEFEDDVSSSEEGEEGKELSCKVDSNEWIRITVDSDEGSEEEYTLWKEMKKQRRARDPENDKDMRLNVDILSPSFNMEISGDNFNPQPLITRQPDVVVKPAPHVAVVTELSWPKLKKLKEQLRLVRSNGYIVERNDFMTPLVTEKVLDAYIVFTRRRNLEWDPNTIGDLSDDEFFSRIEQCICQNHVGVQFDDIIFQSEYTIRRALLTYTGLSVEPVNNFLFWIEEEMEKAGVKEPSEDLVQEMAVLIFDIIDIDPNIDVVLKHARCELAKMLREEWAKDRCRRTWKNLSQLIRAEAGKLRDRLAVAYRCGLEITTAGKELGERDFYLYCQSQGRDWSLEMTSQQPQSGSRHNFDTSPQQRRDAKYIERKRHAEHESQRGKKQKISRNNRLLSNDSDNCYERSFSFFNKEDIVEASIELIEDIQQQFLKEIQSYVVNREPSFNKGKESTLYHVTRKLYKREKRTREDRLKTWNQFESFLEDRFQHSQDDKKKIIIVDGANIGYYKQNYPGAPLHVNYHQINRLIEQLIRYFDFFPIIILHARHLHPAIDSTEEYDQAQTILGEWRKAGYLYATPKGFNDDWFWMYASIKYQCYIITNDEMRDHYFQLLSPR